MLILCTCFSAYFYRVHRVKQAELCTMQYNANNHILFSSPKRLVVIRRICQGVEGDATVPTASIYDYGIMKALGMHLVLPSTVPTLEGSKL